MQHSPLSGLAMHVGSASPCCKMTTDALMQISGRACSVRRDWVRKGIDGVHRGRAPQRDTIIGSHA